VAELQPVAVGAEREGLPTFRPSTLLARPPGRLLASVRVFPDPAVASSGRSGCERADGLPSGRAGSRAWVGDDGLLPVLAETWMLPRSTLDVDASL